MSDIERLVHDAIEVLDFARRGTIAEAANIPDGRWDFRPHPQARSVAELVHHIVQGTAMLLGEATDPEGDFQRRPPHEHVREHAADVPDAASDPEVLREALEDVHRRCLDAIRAATPEHWLTEIRRFDGESWTRLTYLFYAASHEDYHRGQLASWARIMGLVPALTQKIHGEDAG